MTQPIDFVQLSILAHALQAITEEMGANLVRSSFSTIIREAHDCSTAILNPGGEVVAQSAMIPMQTRALSWAFIEVRKRLDLGRLTADSAILLNDPYSGGQHLNDIILFQPVFVADELAGFVGSTAHHIDIGGADAGVNTRASHILQEGLVLPPLMFDIKRDWQGGFVESIIRANVRMSETVLGDLRAQFAANHTGIVRLCELIGREGLPRVHSAMAAVLTQSEKQMREAIAAIPDGTYHGEAMLDRDAFDDRPVTVRVRVDVSDTDIALDFSGTDGQVRGMFNCPLASSQAGALSAIRCLIAAEGIASNDGCNRPIRAFFPEGSILNPRWPAPVRARAIAAYRAFDAVHDALSKAMPERVPARGFNTTTALYLSQQRQDGSARIYVDIYGGGLGACRNYDGASAVDVVMSNCRTTPIEAAERINPHLRLRSFEILADTGGAGRWRGGLGFRRSIEILEEGCTVSLYSDRFRFPAGGLEGGRPGALGSLVVQRGDQMISLSPTSTYTLERGDVVHMSMGGGGGWGDPAARDAAALENDLTNGWITTAGLSAYKGN